ncbi:MAG TPA: FAD-binding oxidoreductase [Polyangiaceae bacterium]|nr:FAD-binding oxidoreductase [Polyangiaceae bacterium]
MTTSPIVDTAALTPFRARLRGPLLLPDADPTAFSESVTIWNGMVKSRPALVVRPSGTADVVECVRFAAERRIPIAPKGGGHNLAGTCLPEHGLTVDFCRLKAVHVDAKKKLAHVQPGALLGDVDRETQLHGLATVLGFVSETGVAGLTLGGGYGYLTRRFGWTSDNLVEAEVVTADARVLTANADENPDLFWAIRGGGGNFGIVTRFTYRLHDVGPQVTGGLIAWPGDRAAAVLAEYAARTPSLPRELTLALTVRLAPPAPFLPQEWHGKLIVLLVVCHTGSEAQATADLAPFRALGNPLVDLVARKPYAVQQSMLDATQPRGPHYYWKSEFLPVLTPAARDAFITHASKPATPLSQLVLFHVGGAIREHAKDDGAVGNRDAEYMFGSAGCWLPDDPNAQANIAAVRGAWEAMRPHSTGGVYVNFLTAEEGEDRVRAAYRDNFERLAALKAKFDPTNLFQSNKNVRPSAG